MALGLLAVLTLGGCGDSALGPDPEDATFAASLGIDLAQMTRLGSGVYIKTTTPGTGTATVTATSRVTTDYSGWLADGTLFDRGTISNRPITDFVPGFSQGLVGMKVGEVRKIVIPSSLGYGDKGVGDIPGKSVLVFELKLVAIS
ncbi:MAG: FKBP-type peptidyl-prolyl cis-trans isomerase [Gemmatimonadetes bacterium]|nr:FKBP-type peptidyl-prolyl cis-trans isomerase [Gemmatimonadota bacterium]